MLAYASLISTKELCFKRAGARPGSKCVNEPLYCIVQFNVPFDKL